MLKKKNDIMMSKKKTRAIIRSLKMSNQRPENIPLL